MKVLLGYSMFLNDDGYLWGSDAKGGKKLVKLFADALSRKSSHFFLDHCFNEDENFRASFYFISVERNAHFKRCRL